MKHNSPIKPIRQYRCMCMRCSHEWVTRNERKPKVCPACVSRKWETPRKTQKMAEAIWHEIITDGIKCGLLAIKLLGKSTILIIACELSFALSFNAAMILATRPIAGMAARGLRTRLRSMTWNSFGHAMAPPRWNDRVSTGLMLMEITSLKIVVSENWEPIDWPWPTETQFQPRLKELRKDKLRRIKWT